MLLLPTGIATNPMDSELRSWANEQLTALGFTQAPTIEPLRVEASHRVFYRLGQKPSVVLMSSPPTLENNRQFELLAEVFKAHGVGVPKLLACNTEQGWYLMSDLGSVHLADVYANGDADVGVRLAIDTLLDIQAIEDPAIAPYTAQRFHDELAIFRDWFVEGWLGVSFPEQDLAPAFAQLVEITQRQPQCCVHRDFHCRNLLLHEGRIGVVDFQDALVGPAAYDLASLLRDCYYRFPEAAIDQWRDAFLSRSRWDLDPTRFAEDVDLTAAQRQLKAVGIFARLQLRDGKASHLRYLPGVIEQLVELSKRHPLLAPLHPYLTKWRTETERRLGEVAGQ